MSCSEWMYETACETYDRREPPGAWEAVNLKQLLHDLLQARYRKVPSTRMAEGDARGGGGGVGALVRLCS
jgi:hypothetical protein